MPSSGQRGPAARPTPTAFATSLELGDLGQAQAWLDAGLPPDFMGSRIGSGLMIGAWEGNIEMMRLFISRGADINRLNGNGESAIILAAWRGQLEAVKWLVARGARINAPPRQWSPLHYAVFAGHRPVVDYLMEQGADINALSTNGSSVLMMAIYEGREELARMLIEKGAERSFRNDWGDGALEWAMRYNQLNIARMITNPEEFNIAINKPKETWGEPTRSLRMSKELEESDGDARETGRARRVDRGDRQADQRRARARHARRNRPPGNAGARRDDGDHRQSQGAEGAVGADHLRRQGQGGEQEGRGRKRAAQGPVQWQGCERIAVWIAQAAESQSQPACAGGGRGAIGNYLVLFDQTYQDGATQTQCPPLPVWPHQAPPPQYP